MSDNLQGVLFMLLASLLFALMATFIKMLPGIPVLEIIFFRAVISALICWVGIRRAGVGMLGNNKPLLIGRGLAGTVSLALNFYLLQTIPLAAASTLTHLAPITTTLIGIWFVREHITPAQLAFFLLSFAGVVVIQGFDARITLFHLGIGLMTSVFMGLAYNCVRKLSKSEHPLVIIFYFPLMCIPVTGLWTLLHWTAPAPVEWFYLLMIGLTTQAAQYFMTRSYQLAAISTVSIVNYTGILYAIGIGYIFFNESFNIMTYVGMAMVVAGVVINVLYQQLRQRKRVSGAELNLSAKEEG